MRIIRPIGIGSSRRKILCTIPAAITSVRCGRCSRDGLRLENIDYHRAVPAYSNLRSNALLAIDGTLGHVTEVLSGDYYQPLSTSSPHQIWSAAMVVSPVLRGLLGLEIDATSHQLRFAPHVPAGWKSFEVRNVHVADAVLDLKYERTEEGLTLEMRRTGSGDCLMEFAPALNSRSRARKSTDVPFHCASNVTARINT